MGSKCSIARLCLLPDPFGGEIRRNTEGQGKLNTIYAGLSVLDATRRARVKTMARCSQPS